MAFINIGKKRYISGLPNKLTNIGTSKNVRKDIGKSQAIISVKVFPVPSSFAPRDIIINPIITNQINVMTINL